jgi:pimeloyl-ACP methyl ester carboxylesterase
MNNLFPFQLENKNNILAGIKVAQEKDDLPNFLFLHGGGLADKFRTLYLAQKLLTKNISSIAFDHSGSGESSGLMKNSSLFQRCQEAEQIIKNFLPTNNLTICGSSMGGYVALKMLELDFEIKNLILFCPAIYDRQAFKVNFNQDFSNIIRQKKSWEKSDIFPFLKKFTGNLLIFIGENDKIIPREVIQLLDRYSLQVKKKEIVILPKMSHSLHKKLAQDEELTDFVVDKIKKFIKY